MITQREISQIAFREQMSDRIIEKDYALTWLLLALASSSLAEHLVFKGGTALKKIYFPDYRYSEDLDFTVVGEIAPDELIAGLREVLDGLAREQGFQFDLPESRIERRSESLTAYVSFVGPLQARLGSRDVKIDFTLAEKLIFLIDERPILSAFSDQVERSILSYSLEEIVTEKLCAVIGRTEPRDIYDLHFLLNRTEIDLHLIPAAFVEKSCSKGVDPSRLHDALEKKKPTLARMWEIRLRHQVKEPPHLEQVLRELNRKLKENGLLGLTR